MTRVLSEGFEMGDLIGITTVNGNNQSTYKRSGTYAWYGGKNSDLTLPVSDLTEAYLRFGFWWDDLSAAPWHFWIQWRHGTTVLGGIYIDLDLNALLQAQVSTTTQATGTIPIVKETWYLIEVHIKIDDAAGAIDTKIDGVLDVAFSGDTKPGADAHFDNFYFSVLSGGAGTNVAVALDDLGINNTAGGVDDTWLGDGKIIIIKPNGDTATLELTPSAAVSHYTLVDEVPADSDTTYVEGSVDDERDIYNLEACGLSDVIITRIWTEARARDTGASGKSVALITKASGGAEVSGGDVALGATYTTKILGAEQLVNPVDAAAWEVADIDALQAGPKTRP